MDFIFETAEEIDKALALRIRQVRKRRSISQEELSKMSGVSLGSLKRFESTGKISLLSLTKLAMALDCPNEIKDMFTKVTYKSINEVIEEEKMREKRNRW